MTPAGANAAWLIRRSPLSLESRQDRRQAQACGLRPLEGQGADLALTLRQGEGRYWAHEDAGHDRRLLARVTPQRQDAAPLPRRRAPGAQRGGPRQRLSLLLRGPDPDRPG